MSESKNVIELNGNLYDASTGKLVNPSSGTHAPSFVQPHNGKAIDGFVIKPTKHKARAHHAPQKIQIVTDKPRPHHTAGKHAAAHQPHHSKTLVRRGLKKPNLETGTVSAPIAEQQPTLEANTPNSNSRLERAKSVAKSAKISRFGNIHSNGGHSFVKKTSHMPVKQAPAHVSHQNPILQQRRALVEEEATSTKEHNKVVKEKLVAEAIKQARVPEASHKHHKKHRVAEKLGVSHKLLRYGTSALALVLIAGFIAYQNAANISMRIASSRAGFTAGIPTYKPSGFSLNGPVEYGPGQITLNFKSNSDERNFHITQRVSNWNSEALVTNFVSANNKTYQTFQDKGRTIYIYDGSNATWVSNGVWYQIEGNSSLTSEQLLHIASSI